MSKISQPWPPSTGSDKGRLQKLAKGIEALAAKDRKTLDRARQIAGFRQEAADELYSLCAHFVDSLNELMADVEVQLDPSRDGSTFHETGPNLFQINARGRILEISYLSTDEMLSTEDFRIPYALSGEIRAFNQDLLDRNLIEEQCLFFTVEGEKRLWRYFDPRTHRSGVLDQSYLISMMELLI